MLFPFKRGQGEVPLHTPVFPPFPNCFREPSARLKIIICTRKFWKWSFFIIVSLRSKLAEYCGEGACCNQYNTIFYWMYNTYYIVASSLTGRELWSMRDKTMGMMWWWNNLYFFFSSRQFPTLTSLDVYQLSMLL